MRTVRVIVLTAVLTVLPFAAAAAHAMPRLRG